MNIRRSKGFTLIEIAIVLLIGTLILVAVLKGQSVVNSAKTNALIAQIKDLTDAVHGFRNTTGYLPGDMPNAGGTFSSVNATCNYALGAGGAGPGDTRIDTVLKSACVTEQLFAAGLIKAKVDPQTSLHFQTHPFFQGLDYTVAPFQEPIRIIDTPRAVAQLPTLVSNRNIPHYIQIDNLPCNIALEIDTKFDDGDMGNGRVMSNPPPPAPPLPACQDPPQLITLFVPFN